MTQPPACLNCGTLLTGKYCSACGQKSATARITTANLIHEVPHAVFHVDRGLIPTVKALFTQPATLITEYLQGRRIVYFNPLTLLVLCSTLCASMWVLFPFNAPLFWGSRVIDPRLAELLTHWFKLVGLSQLIWLPLTAGWLYWTFRGARQWNLEHNAPQRDLRAIELRLKRRKALFPALRMLVLRWWFYIFGGVHYRKLIREGLQRQPVHLNYGELLVAASFLTSASLIINALASPLVYWITDARLYAAMICVVAVVSACPVLQYLLSAPREYRPTTIGAVIGAVYFVVGTPFGFLLAAKVGELL